MKCRFNIFEVFSDIKKIYIFDINRIIDIKNNPWYEKKLLISKNLFSDIMKSFFEIANSKSWYQNMIFWSHRIDYLISRIKVVSLDQENVFLISENHFFIYQKIELISKSFLY